MRYSHRLDMLRGLSKPRCWEILLRLAEGPATTQQLMDHAALSRNHVLTELRTLISYGLVHRPPRRRGIDPLIVARQPEQLKSFIVAFEAYYEAILEADRVAHAQDVAFREELKTPTPAPPPRSWIPVLLQGGEGAKSA
jgi:hypothetical protein